MKRLVVGLLVLAVFAAPCVYDAFSPEPSPIAALAAPLVFKDRETGNPKGEMLAGD